MDTSLFPKATHLYLRLKNLTSARQDFLRSSTRFPVFEYYYNNPQLIKERLEILRNDRINFEKLHLVLLSMNFRANPTESNLKAYRKLNALLYGEPKMEYLWGIFAPPYPIDMHIHKQHLSYLKKNLPSGLFEGAQYKPSESFFEVMRAYFYHFSGIDKFHESSDLHTTMSKGLALSGLSQQGWVIKIVPGDSHAVTIHNKKQIRVGEQYKTRSTLSQLQVMVHEVYGHALRGSGADIAESEGFATILEQLIAGAYSTRRSYRFLAASLGWGADGKQRNFREVYEIIWRAMVVRGRYSEVDAKVHAFDECARVFRGGLPEIKGSVYLKDSMYFFANISSWRYLESTQPTYEEFIKLATGKRRMKL